MTCELIARRDAGEAPPWDTILRTGFWDVAHAYNTSLPGWLCLIARRHIATVAELSDGECGELGVLLRDVSAALRLVTGCAKTYVVQFADHPDHPHVHFHLIPKAADLPPERAAVNVFSHLGVGNAERVAEDEMDAIAAEVRKLLVRNRPSDAASS